MARRNILYTFGPSHFCEKARWALDCSDTTYREVRWAPGPHVLLSRRMSKSPSVPLLRASGGIVQGSGAIMDWLEAWESARWWTPDGKATRAEIRRLEERFDTESGVHIRRLVYATTTSFNLAPMKRQNFRGIAWWQRPLANLMWPTTRKIMVRGMQLGEGAFTEAWALVDRELTYLDGLLADGREHLVGERLSRADITVAALLSPLAGPPEHPLYRDGEVWPALLEIIEAWRDRPSIRWARDVYREFRRVPAV